MVASMPFICILSASNAMVGKSKSVFLEPYLKSHVCWLYLWKLLALVWSVQNDDIKYTILVLNISPKFPALLMSRHNALSCVNPKRPDCNCVAERECPVAAKCSYKWDDH